MKTAEFEILIDQLLGANTDQAISAEIARIRARLVERLDATYESNVAATKQVSAADIAAYVSGALGEDEKKRFEADMAASPAVMLEVLDAVEFLGDVEAHIEAAPEGLEDPAMPPVVAFGADQIEALFRDGKSLSHEQQRQLFGEPRLRELFTKIKHDYAMPLTAIRGLSRQSGGIAEMQRQVAAASDTALDHRSFAGGTVNIVKSPRKEDVLIQFTLVGWERWPRALLLEGADGELAHVELPQPSSDGKVILIKDMGKDEDAAFVRLLRDPTSVGTFLK